MNAPKRIKYKGQIYEAVEDKITKDGSLNVGYVDDIYLFPEEHVFDLPKNIRQYKDNWWLYPKNRRTKTISAIDPKRPWSFYDTKAQVAPMMFFNGDEIRDREVYDYVSSNCPAVRPVLTIWTDDGGSPNFTVGDKVIIDEDTEWVAISDAEVLYNDRNVIRSNFGNYKSDPENAEIYSVMLRKFPHNCGISYEVIK